MADNSVHCCVTSPPYFRLRSYLPEGHPDKGKEIGLEQSVAEYLERMVAVFREVRRVLRDDGVCFVNIGDSYWSGSTEKELKPKDLIMIPARLALALQADGWWVRSEIVWCISGGAWLYAKTQKGAMPMMLRDIARLDPNTVQLWNGEKWTQLLGMSKSARKGTELELVLRSGERISCTPTHKFPTQRGLLEASEIVVGDTIKTCQLPEPEAVRDCLINEDAAWLAGLYIAEGSRSDDCIQIAGHAKEEERWVNVQRIAKAYGGSATQTVFGNKMDIRIYGKVLVAIIDELVSGRIAKDKGISPVAWRYSNHFLAALLRGYLSGDGHFEKKNNRWRIGFARNYNLERDLRTLCARLGYTLRLTLSSASCNGKLFPIHRGEIRLERSGHWNERQMGRVVEIRKSRCREVYDLGVADEPHLFALASGVLTHNCKPNPMPESIADRPTMAHEKIFLITKSARYFWDADAVREDSIGTTPGDLDGGAQRNRDGSNANAGRNYRKVKVPGGWDRGAGAHGTIHRNGRTSAEYQEADIKPGRNIRNVWTIPSAPFPDAHFATFPPRLAEICILAGTSAHGCCAACGAPWRRVVAKGKPDIERQRACGGDADGAYSGQSMKGHDAAGVQNASDVKRRILEGMKHRETSGWEPTCWCRPTRAVIPCTVLDPFGGAGTVGLVADRLRRDAVLIELNAEYVAMAKRRIEGDSPLLAVIS